jgi:hypothetical protein
VLPTASVTVTVCVTAPAGQVTEVDQFTDAPLVVAGAAVHTVGVQVGLVPVTGAFDRRATLSVPVPESVVFALVAVQFDPFEGEQFDTPVIVATGLTASPELIQTNVRVTAGELVLSLVSFAVMVTTLLVPGAALQVGETEKAHAPALKLAVPLVTEHSGHAHVTASEACMAVSSEAEPVNSCVPGATVVEGGR